MSTERAVFQMFLEGNQRVKKAQFRDGRYTKAFMKFNRKAVERGQASWYFDPAFKVSGRRIVQRTWAISAQFIPTIIYKKQTEPVIGDIRIINVEAKGLRQDAERVLAEQVQRTLALLEGDSPTASVESHEVRNISIIEKTDRTKPRANGGELRINGFEDGRRFMPEGINYACGYYAIEHRYGNVAGWKKQATKHFVYNLLYGTNYKSWEEVVKHEPDTHEGRLEYYALNAAQLVKWGQKTNTSVYVIDEDSNLYEDGLYKADNPRKNRPLALLMKNGHFYLLEQEETLRSLGARFSTNNFRKTSENSESEKKYTTVYLPADRAEDELTSIVRSTGILPTKKGLRLNGDSGLLSCVIGDTQYIVESKGHQHARRLAELNERTNQPEQTLTSYLSHLIKTWLGDEYKSKPPKATTELLNAHKNYNHLGATPHYRHQVNKLKVNGQTLPEDTIGYDINSQDYCSMLYPSEPPYKMGFNSVPTLVPEDDLPLGFYFINTCDEKLAMGSGLYCRAFTALMLEEGLCTKNDLKYYIPCEPCRMKPLKDLLWAVDEETKKDKALQKIARNTIAGLLGKSMTKYATGYVVEIQNIQEAMNFYCGLDGNRQTRPFIRRGKYYEDEQHLKENDLYLYGCHTKYPRAQHYLPIYLQILQWGAMRLYQHLKPYWKNVIYRKRDAFFVKPYKGFVAPATSDEVGQLKEEAPPKALFANPPKPDLPNVVINKQWATYHSFDSTNAREILEIIKTHGGAEIDARAGYGKTHATRELISIAEKELNWKIARCAFTNKASNNLCGITIHKLFGMDITDSEPKPQVANQLSKTYDLIVFDEKSMIPASLWCLITQLNTRILIVGDWRQLPPVELDANRKYQHHPSIHDICKGQRIELKRSEHCRYDTQLEKISKNVMIYNPAKSNVITDLNIAWSNACVIKVNKQVLSNKKGARYPAPPTPKKWLEYKDGADKHWAGVNWDIVIGQPLVVACATKELRVSKNEMVRVKAIDNEKIYFEDELGSILRVDFWKLLRPAYCITTHKAQGDTFAEAFGIWEWERMNEELRYTAITRARALDQIHFH